jgi:hypothetical protein
MQIDETVHGCPVAVVHLIVRVEILALQVKSAPPRDSRLWLRPQAALCGVKFFPKLFSNAADGLAMNAAGLDETDHLFPARRGQPLRSLAHGPVTEHFALPAAVTARSAATTITAAAPVQVPPGAARSACNSA